MDSRQPDLLQRSFVRLPELYGQPIEIVFLPALSAHRGKLLSGLRDGQEIHAASFLRQRRIVFDTGLRRESAELRRIFVHELFHFVWLRLGNTQRRSYEAILADEMRRGVGGELGWSAESRKLLLERHDVARRTRRWRGYACESFCDSAAWLLVGVRHQEFTLPAPARRARRQWFVESGLTRRVAV